MRFSFGIGKSDGERNELAVKAFCRGLDELKRHQLKQAYWEFAQAEYLWRNIPGKEANILSARTRRGIAIAGQDRFKAALKVFDDVVGNGKRADLSADVLVLAAAGRVLCLKHLGRFAEAESAAVAFLKDWAPGGTPIQRSQVATVLISRAEAAEAGGQSERALDRYEEAIGYCSQCDEEKVRPHLRDALAQRDGLAARLSSTP